MRRATRAQAHRTRDTVGRRRSEQVHRAVLAEGAVTLDEIFQTLSVTTFGRYESPTLYDEYGNRFKRVTHVHTALPEFYVMYKRPLPKTKGKFAKIKYIRRGDTVTLFDNGRQHRYQVSGVIEDPHRVLSARIMCN